MLQARGNKTDSLARAFKRQFHFAPKLLAPFTGFCSVKVQTEPRDLGDNIMLTILRKSVPQLLVPRIKIQFNLQIDFCTFGLVLIFEKKTCYFVLEKFSKNSENLYTISTLFNKTTW